MKINLVCYENPYEWICGKFALKMHDCLNQLGVENKISSEPDSSFDINHHIIYGSYDGSINGIDTVMITHVDRTEKIDLLKRTIPNAGMGICMSNQVMEWLSQMGISTNKLCYVDPAHDECAIIKKFVIGIASRVYSDGRKREYFFDNFSKDLDPKYFEFKFMGAGWEHQVSSLKNAGFSVVYFDDFNREEYYKFIASLDYYIYTGHDEGQMGFVDAAAAGVKSIVTPQGYHLDAPEALSYPFDTYEECLDILKSIQEERKRIVESVKNWTWMNYTLKHLEIWRYLLGEKVESEFADGLNSHLRLNSSAVEIDADYIKKEKRKLENERKRQKFQTGIRFLKEKGLYKTIKHILNK